MFKKSKSHHFFSMSLPFTNHLLWGQVNNHQDHGLSEIKSSNFICLSNFILNFASLNNFVYLNETLKEDYLLAFWNIQFFHVLVLHQIKVILLQEKVTEEFQLLANQYGIIVVSSYLSSHIHFLLNLNTFLDSLYSTNQFGSSLFKIKLYNS